ncbi:hypothetical protein H6F88_26710 [Oculatella sp. FACHB-28]|nr:hypothetical protein [Cyanobacteria bacterium FACHB-471]MBD2000175.1 hypothetical protein [Leptolyngbya sp. FACHB-541]MBD2059544.1 hypothetical protein [Oculatella sp. FACHB-28]MBD2068816.1 hypothetical protein [Leptolyngbya sp. FACHB-671]
MPPAYSIFLLMGLGIIWVGLKTGEEIIRIAAAIAGAILLVWGFALTPLSLQLFVEIISVMAVFSVCVRCLKA